MHMLIAGSDLTYLKMTRFVLEGAGNTVCCVDDEQALWRQLQQGQVDLVLFDDGFANGPELCREIRALYHRPIIFTAEACPVEERVRALNLGADDVLARPYDPVELLARIEAVMRRYDDDYLRISSTYRPIALGPVKLDPLGRRVVINGTYEELLSQREFQLLYYLVQNAHRVLSSRQLLEQIWGARHEAESNLVPVYIRRLRRKIERNPMKPKHIVWVRDLGYSFRP
jgi:two-component system response regulator RegX3